VISRRVHFRSTFVVAALLTLMLCMVGTGMAQVDTEVKLYLRESGNDLQLSTEAPSSTVGSVTTRADNRKLSFLATDRLQADIVIQPLGPSSSAGVKLSNFKILSTGTTTFTFYADSEKLAEESTSGNVGPELTLPFLGAETARTVDKDSLLKLEITIPALSSFTFEDGGDQSFLSIITDPIDDSAVELEILDGSGSVMDPAVFYPNDILDRRVIRFRGEALDAFGPDDVNSVRIRVMNRSGDVPTEALQQTFVDVTVKNIGDARGVSYSFDWNYPKNLGNYFKGLNVEPALFEATVDIETIQGHIIQASKEFTFYPYGVLVLDPGTTDVAPGKTTILPMTIRNVGGLVDTVDLNVLGPLPTDWDVQWLETGNDLASVALAPGEDREFNLNLTLPENATTSLTHNVKVQARSSVVYKGERESFTRDIIISVQRVFGIELTLTSDPSVEVTGQEPAVFNLTLVNRGFETDTFNLDDPDRPYDWDVTFGLPSKTVELTRGEALHFSVSVTPPERLDAEDEATILIRASSESEPSHSAVVSLEVERRKMFEIDYSGSAIVAQVTDENAYPLGYQELQKTIAITNKDPDTPISGHEVTLSVFDAPPQWIVRFSRGSGSSSTSLTFLLAEDGTVDATIHIHPSSTGTLAAGNYSVIIEAAAADNAQALDRYDLVVKIPDRSRVSLSIPSDEFSFSLGTTSTVLMTVNNEGNTEESYTITADQPTGWTLQPALKTVQLDPGSFNEVSLMVTTPDEDDFSGDDSVVFTVSVSSASGTAEAQTSFSVTVDLPFHLRLAREGLPILSSIAFIFLLGTFIYFMRR